MMLQESTSTSSMGFTNDAFSGSRIDIIGGSSLQQSHSEDDTTLQDLLKEKMDLIEDGRVEVIASPHHSLPDRIMYAMFVTKKDYCVSQNYGSGRTVQSLFSFDQGPSTCRCSFSSSHLELLCPFSAPQS